MKNFLIGLFTGLVCPFAVQLGRLFYRIIN